MLRDSLQTVECKTGDISDSVDVTNKKKYYFEKCGMDSEQNYKKSAIF